MNTLQLEFLLSIFAGWVDRHQQNVIEYLQEENRVLREQLGGKRLLFTDRQRRLAAKAREIGRKGLFEISTPVTPDTLLRWYRRLIARKYDGSQSQTVARDLTDADSGFLIGSRFLIHDRDPLFTEGFRKALESSGVETVKLPARSPDLNAYTEHYHQERNHRGLDNELIEELTDGPYMDGAVDCRERLGGILNHSYRRAA